MSDAVHQDFKLGMETRYLDEVKTLLAKFVPDAEVWVYGSRVTDKSHPASDLDLALRGPGLSKIDDNKLAQLNASFNESDIPFIVVAQDWARLPESFHREIEKVYFVLAPPTV
ncbi:MAG: nucleotidyltransferase domain-containing protein [Acidimicrobiia bacterium]|nr:nucleotidyltransferase domain-containing protein [Acidimicrobiia bacterium]MCY4456399.1 nucleotidyltransferase domain-containing protein [Acidimicrobiaceae bacterium]